MPSYLTGGCLLNDGRVFCAPGRYSIRHLGIYNPSDNSFLKQPYKNYTDTYPFIAAITLSDGNVLLVPNYFNKLVVYNPSTNMIVQMATTSTTNSQYRGAILHTNGKVYLTPKASKNIGIYDLTTNTFSLSTAVCASNSDFCGGVLLADGKICLVPYNSDYVKIYDPATDSVATGAYVSTTNGMFDNGLMMGNGKICFIPTNVYKKIGIYDPVSDTYTDGPVTPHGYFSGGVILDDGRVFLSSNNANATGLYDPSTNTYESGCLLDSTETGGCVKLTDGNVMIIPHGGENILIYDPITDSYEIGPVSTTNDTDFIEIDGDGTVDSPFLINNVHQLFIIENFYINACYFKQTADIELGFYGKWRGIYNYWDEFQGYYDGDGHSINNMETYYAGSIRRGGFWGAVGGNAEIKNLNITNAKLTSGSTDAQGFMTSDARGATFENCHVDGVATQTNGYAIAGFVGLAQKCRFYNCSTNIVINSTIDSSENAGFVSESTNCDFNFCHATVTMTAATGKYMGGAGFCYWIYGDSRIEQCSANGNITGDLGFQESSAFIDWVSNDSLAASGEIIIKDCFADVDLVILNPAVDPGDQGGFIGTLSADTDWSITVQNCHSAGTFSDTAVDAFISLWYSENGGTISCIDNFYDSDKNSGVSSSYASGLNTTNMQVAGNFTNWDFVAVWLLGGDYPEFIGYGVWEIPADPISPINQRYHLGGEYATTATELGKLTINPTGIFYASDGFIYATDGNRVYKTNLELSEFIEMELSGNLHGTFHSFAEAKDGIIIVGDDTMLWTKSKNRNQFGQSESIGYLDAKFSMAGNSDDYNICNLVYKNSYIYNVLFDIRDGKPPDEYFELSSWLTGATEIPIQIPIYVDGHGFIMIHVKVEGIYYRLVAVGTNSFDEIVFDTLPNTGESSYKLNQQPLTLKHSDGSVYGIYRGGGGNDLFLTKTITLNEYEYLFCGCYNAGLTFEEIGLFRGFFERDNGEFIILHNNKIYTTDFKTHLTKTQELDGTDIICTCKVDGYGVIIITNGSTNNAYLLPYENSRIAQPIGASTSNAAAIDHANSVFEDIRNSIETQGIDTEDLPIEHFPMLIREIV